MSENLQSDPVYRAFLLDRNGRVFQAVILAASDDDEAVRQASEIPNLNGLIVYERTRFIVRLSPREGDIS